MVLSRTFEPPDLVVADVSGRMAPRDQMALVEFVRDTLQIVRQVHLLILWHGVAGWQPDASFSDAACWLQDHDRVARLAIVGDPVWRREVLTFIAQPLRPLPIEYFETEAAARRWLRAPAAGGAVPA